MALSGPNRGEAKKLYNNRANARELAVLDKFATQAVTFVWDFSVDGGAAGTYTSDTYLPANCAILRVTTYEETAVTGATDVDVIVGSDEVVSTVDFTGDTLVQSRTIVAAEQVRTAREALGIKINTSAATAGKVHFIVEFVKLED